MADYEFATVDVFTNQRFGGNPLAVFPNARGLTDEQMQKIAREINYSETTFVTPPRDRKNTAEVRIFTPQSELPFAGHPNVGTAWLLAENPGWAPGLVSSDKMIFEERAGPVEAKVRREKSGKVSSCTILAPQKFHQLHSIPRSVVAPCVSLADEQVLVDAVVASVGIPFALVHVTNLEAVKNAKPNIAAFEYCNEHYGYPEEPVCIMIYYQSESGVVHARMFGPLSGIYEDPATGSAAAALAGLLASQDQRMDANIKYEISQGVEMGRPSEIFLEATKAAGEIEAVAIAGRCVAVITGTLSI
ncbi:MAG: PhzF family phenazine biosynthesis protein [Pseudomonadales bacterium]|nr:PhzF family phenazine biosynthesis protein [Pseudomonadales bacterium]